MAKAGTKPKRKPKTKISKAEQSRRFIETARELGVDETGEPFERLARAILKKSPSRRT